jgi:transcriptional regulator with XRE-family HTH domain
VEKVSIGENIKRIRTDRKMSQTELAKEICVSQPMICQLERGTKVPTLPLGKAIADVLGCSIDDLLGSG